MKTDSQIEVASYVSDLIFTLLFVFKNIVHPQSLLDWLRPMLMDDDQRAMLLHEEPLYVAADFLEVNRFAPEFREIEAAYLRFRNEYLTSRISDSKHQMDSSLREFLNMHDNPTKQDVHRLLQSLPLHRSIFKYSIGRDADASLSRLTSSKNIPHHAEKTISDKVRKTEPPASHTQLKTRRRRNTGQHAAAAHPKFWRQPLSKSYLIGQEQ